MDTRTILLDVGGTFIKRNTGDPVPIPSNGSREAIAEALRKAVTPGLTGGITRIGVAIPGPFHYKEGIFLMKHKFAAVYGERFRDLAGIPENVSVKYIHDVNAVLEGAIEIMGLKTSNTALVSLGTGLGFSIALNGEVRYGPTGSPADSIWNLPWQGGILEDFASARGVVKAWTALGGEAGISPADIAGKAYAGDAMAQKAYNSVGEVLGTALKEKLEEFEIDTLLFSGQISKSLSLMEEGLRKHLNNIRISRAPEGAVYRGISGLFE